MKLRTATIDTVFRLERAARDLRTVRAEVRFVGAPKALKALAKAQKSLDGALRHAERASMYQDGYPWSQEATK